jgi:hypothetical protein
VRNSGADGKFRADENFRAGGKFRATGIFRAGGIFIGLAQFLWVGLPEPPPLPPETGVLTF